MATLCRVSLWDQQQVLAECGQIVPAQWTPVRRRLAVLGAPDEPPTRLHLARHPAKHDTEGAADGMVTRAMEQFSTDRIIPQYEQYYQDVLGR